MPPASLTLQSWFGRGWGAFRSNPKIVIAASLILNADGQINSLLPAWIGSVNDFGIGPILSGGFITITLAIARGETASIRSLIPGFQLLIKILTVLYAYTLIVVGGLLLFIIPGLIWGARFSLALYGVMDRSLSVREALRFSRCLTTGRIRILIGAFCLTIFPMLLIVPFILGQWGWGPNEGRLLLALGAVPYGFAIIVLFPWLSVVWAVIYHDLVALSEAPQVTT